MPIGTLNLPMLHTPLRVLIKHRHSIHASTGVHCHHIFLEGQYIVLCYHIRRRVCVAWAFGRSGRNCHFSGYLLVQLFYTKHVLFLSSV